jgi:hypothetical protein
MPPFYQEHLKSQLSRSQYLLLSCLIHLLQTIKQVRLETLATALPLPIRFESRRRKLQRFLKLPQLTFRTLWFPIILAWIKAEFEVNSLLYLAIDRTSWAGVNLLMVSLIVDKRAIPLYCERLNKAGSSNLSEQQAVLQPVLELLKAHQLVVLGDREFCSVKLGHWLTQQSQQVWFCLRLRRNEQVQLQESLWVELGALGLKAGMNLYLNDVQVTHQKGFGTFNLVAKWKKRYRGWAPSEGWFILTNFTQVEDAIVAYQSRFSIEELFRDLKSGGYNLEGIAVSSERLMPLLVVLTLAYATATWTGKQLKRMGVQSYIGRVREPRRREKRHSNFYIGLYGQTWLNYWGYCQEMISELMQLSPHKRKYYRKGLRAMELIMSAS